MSARVGQIHMHPSFPQSPSPSLTIFAPSYSSPRGRRKVRIARLKNTWPLCLFFPGRSTPPCRSPSSTLSCVTPCAVTDRVWSPNSCNQTVPAGYSSMTDRSHSSQRQVSMEANRAVDTDAARTAARIALAIRLLPPDKLPVNALSMRLSVLFRARRGVPWTAAPRRGSSSWRRADSRSCQFRRSGRRLHHVLSTVCRAIVKELSFDTAPYTDTRRTGARGSTRTLDV